MIDPDLLAIVLDDNEYKIVKQSLITLSSHDVWNHQITRIRERLHEGSSEEDPATLAERIIAGRREIRFLQSMQEFGDSLSNED